MRSIRQFLYAAIVAVAFMATGTARAQSTVYPDRASWQTAVGTSTSIDFSTLDNGSPITNPANDTLFAALNLRGVSFLNVYSYFNSYIYGENRGFRVNLPSNTSAVAFDAAPLFDAFGTFTVTLSTGEVFTAESSGASAVPTFFGIRSAAPIQWFEIVLDTMLVQMDDFSFVAPHGF